MLHCLLSEIDDCDVDNDDMYIGRTRLFDKHRHQIIEVLLILLKK